MTTFRLATYSSESGPRAGVIIGDRIHDAALLLADDGYSTVLAILGRWASASAAIREAAAKCTEESGHPLETVRLTAPVVHPPAVFCAGANYGDHVRAMAAKLGLERFPDPRAGGGKPFHFLKASRCCVGPDSRVSLPSRDLDWEAELVAVIGRPARNVGVDQALDYVAGYMVGNDLSARDKARRPEVPASLPFSFSWLDSKSFEDAAPIGPWIVPAEDVGDPLNLDIRTWVNGMLRQDSNTSEMIFTVQEQIAYLSTQITLQPGDVIFTGTPAGAGAESGEFLRRGDTVVVEIEKIGQLTTYIV